jgi:hypothetical protein
VAPVRRRDFVCAGLAAAGEAAWPFRWANAAPASRVRPGEPGWPGESEWAQLSKATGGRLSRSPPSAQLDAAIAANGHNPFFRGDTPGLTESAGWLDAWRSEPSAYVVTADWQRAQWGDHYGRLAAIKQKYDPKGLFFVHHGAGSEGWSADGFTRTG